jgi:adenylate cyclase class IV
MYEVELRGALTRDEYQSLDSFLSDHGEFKVALRRFLIHYSSTSNDIPSHDEPLDVRLRVTNGTPEIIVKIGEFGGKHRKEGSVLLEAGQFDRAIEVLNMLGFRKGIGAFRDIRRYMYEGVEFSLVEVPGYAYFYEAEKVVSINQVEDAHSEVLALLNELELGHFDKHEFYDFLDDLDKNANILFDADRYFPGDVDVSWLQ